MLQFLQTGKVLYVLAGVCGLGIISKLVTSSLYKRLMKETGNMALTKNKNLRSFKQKTENMFLLSHGIRNVNAYIEKQLYSFRFMRMSLDSWDNMSVQAMILCFLIGGLGAFGAYWYRCDSYYIVLYGTMGILSGLALVLVDNSVNTSLKRQQLVDTLIDYVENSPHFYRTLDKSAENTGSEKRESSLAAVSKSRLREMGRSNLRAVSEAAASEAAVSGVGFHSEIGQESEMEESDNGEDKHVKSGSKLSVLSRKKNRKEPAVQRASVSMGQSGRMAKGAGSPGDMECDKNGRSANSENIVTEEDELLKSINYLKQSLEQIAASREQMRQNLKVVKSTENAGLDRARKELKPEDIKLIGEMLQEYLT